MATWKFHGKIVSRKRKNCIIARFYKHILAPHPHPGEAPPEIADGVVGSSETAKRKGVGSQLSKDQDILRVSSIWFRINPATNQSVKSRPYIYWVRVRVTGSNFIQDHPSTNIPAWTSEAFTPIARKVLLPAVFPKIAHSIMSIRSRIHDCTVPNVLERGSLLKGVINVGCSHVPIRHRKQLGIIRIKYKSHQQTLQVHFTSGMPMSFAPQLNISRPKHR